MPTYKYTAFDLQRKKYKGIFIAENEEELAAQLARQDLYLVSSKIYKAGTPSAFFTTGTGKVSARELTLFCRQFSIMISTGIQVLDCIDSLKQQPFSSFFRSILQVISEDMKGGLMLSASLDRHRKVFPNFFVSMVKIGETGGNLDAVFISLADYYEFDSDIKRKTRNALAYPIMLLFMTIGIVILMLAFVVPTFKEAMSDINVEITGFTRTVYSVSDFLISYWDLLVAALIIIVGGLIIFFLTPGGKRVLDVFMVRAPLIRKITINLISARFARSFYILLSSGMDLTTALDTVSIIFGNSYIENKFNEAAARVRRGVSLTVALQTQKLFPNIMIQMIAVGEKTASLEEVLARACKFFDDLVDDSLNSFVAKIQPIMLLIMGAVVGTLFIAVYAPMLDMMNSLTGTGGSYGY